MSQIELTPLKRNNYYEGKPMRAEDFVLEQEYRQKQMKHVSKPLHNKVVQGLYLDRGEEGQLTVHKGYAYDADGRLMNLSEDMQLSLKDLYKEESAQSENLYIYMSYDEETIKEEEKQEYIEEKVKFHAHTCLPQGYRQCKLYQLYDKEGIRVHLALPSCTMGMRYIKGYLFVDKPREKAIHCLVTAKLKGALTTDYLNTFSLDVQDDSSETFLETSVTFQVSPKGDESLSVNLEEASIEVDGKQEKMKKQFYLIGRGEQGDVIYDEKELCIGRIHVTHDGEYKIDEVESLQGHAEEDRDLSSLKIKSNVLDLMPNEATRVDVKYGSREHELNFTFGIPKSLEDLNHNAISTGVVSLHIKSGIEGRCYYSDLIDHELGQGPAGLILGVEEKMKQLSGLPEPEEQIIFGDMTVFAESDCVTRIPAVDLGSILYPLEGKFKIGLRLKQNTKLKKINVRWWAYKNMNEIADEAEAKKAVEISITPDRIELQKGQKIQLKAMVNNADNKDVTWRLMDEAGGRITQKGFYTAPMNRGVYKIEATSVADFSKTATVIVAVKE